MVSNTSSVKSLLANLQVKSVEPSCINCKQLQHFQSSAHPAIKATINITLNLTTLNATTRIGPSLVVAASSQNPSSSSKVPSQPKDRPKKISSSTYNFYEHSSIAPKISRQPRPNPSSFLKQSEAHCRLKLDKHELLFIRPDFEYFELKRHFKRPWAGHPTKRPFWVTQEEKKMLHEWDTFMAKKSSRQVKKKKAVVDKSGSSQEKELTRGFVVKGKKDIGLKRGRGVSAGHAMAKEGKSMGLRSAGKKVRRNNM